MTAQRERLFRILEHLLRIRAECSCGILSECGLADITVKQVRYLQTIDENGEVTFTRLAEITRNSKPTITEMIHRFERDGCVYRDRCPNDARTRYIRLTERGQMIARAEEETLRRVIDRMTDTLSDHEIDLLIEILGKVR